MTGLGAAPAWSQCNLTSDDFYSTALKPFWTFLAPAGGSMALTGTNLLLTVPSGANHDPSYNGQNNSVRLTQCASNQDFTVEAKFDSVINQQWQIQGILVQQDSANYLRFEFVFDGTNLRVASSSITNGGSAVSQGNLVLSGTPAAPLWLRVARTGNTWTESWSADGGTFTSMTGFSMPLTVTSVGPYAGNYNATASAAPGFTASIDYFFNGNSPIIPQDNGQSPAPPVLGTPTVTPTTSGATIAWTTNESATTKIEYGLSAAYGYTYRNTTFATSHSVTLGGLTCSTPYHYRLTGWDAVGSLTVLGDMTFNTQNCPSSPASDDFSSGPSAIWTFVNPQNDGSVAGPSNGSNGIGLSVQGPLTNETWANDMSPRLMQQVPDGDFQIETKFSAYMNQSYQAEGIIVEEVDTNNYLCFGVGEGVNQATLWQASFFDGVDPNQTNPILTNTVVRNDGPDLYMRLTRTGLTNWLFSYSYDGIRWVDQPPFTRTLHVNRVGVYVQNVGLNGGPAPAYSTTVDYFINRADPLPPSLSPPPSGPIIDIWYGDNQTFGQRGLPQQWINVLGNVSDASGIASLTYTLDGGSPQNLWTGENQARLVEPGDFNVEIDATALTTGTHIVTITAVGKSGGVTSRQVTVNFLQGGPWPKNYTIDWTTVQNIQDVAQIVDGKWEIQPDGTVRTLQVGYDRLIALGDMNSWEDYDVLVPLTINGVSRFSFGVGVIVGWKGHTTLNYGIPLPDQPRTGHPFPGLGWYSTLQNGVPGLNIYTNDGDPYWETVLATLPSTAPLQTLDIGVPYYLRFRVQHADATHSNYYLKAWPVGQPEPPTWGVSALYSLSQGSIVLGAYLTDVSFGKVVVTDCSLGSPTCGNQ